MPALRLYARAGESFIATDPKAELYERTLPLLEEQGYRVFVLNLREPLQSNCWDPLEIPYRLYKNGHKDKAVSMVTDLSYCIVKEGTPNAPYWNNTAADLFTGLILIMFEHADEQEIHFKSLRVLRTQAFKICEYNKGEGAHRALAFPDFVGLLVGMGLEQYRKGQTPKTARAGTAPLNYFTGIVQIFAFGAF